MKSHLARQLTRRISNLHGVREKLAEMTLQEIHDKVAYQNLASAIRAIKVAIEHIRQASLVLKDHARREKGG